MANLSCGIIGLPNVGKSTLFNLLTGLQAEASNYAFCTIEPNVGIVEVIDPKVQVLADLSKSKRVVYATVEIRDIAGLVAGASQGEGLGNQFLSHIRQTDAILHMVRCFDSEQIAHVSATLDPIRDIEIVKLELILADLQMVEKILPKIEKRAKGDRSFAMLVNCLHRVQTHLNANLPISTLELTKEEIELLKPYPFLTAKKVLYVANVGDPDEMENNEEVQKVKAYAAQEGANVLTISAKLEEEIAQLPKEERQEFLLSMGLRESGLNRLIREAFSMLNLITFLTSGEPETRAWPIQRGTSAEEAAGKIHSDIQKGFIRAEVISYEDLVAYGSRQAAKEAGKARAEGRHYTVQENDVILFFHS